MKTASIVIAMLFGMAAAQTTTKPAAAATTVAQRKAREEQQNREAEDAKRAWEERQKIEEEKLVKDTKPGTQAWRDEQRYIHDKKQHEELRHKAHEMSHHWQHERHEIHAEARHDRYLMKAAEERANIWHDKADIATLRSDEERQEARVIRNHVDTVYAYKDVLRGKEHTARHEFKRELRHDKKAEQEIRQDKEFQEAEKERQQVHHELRELQNSNKCHKLFEERKQKEGRECFHQQSMNMRPLYNIEHEDREKMREAEYQWVNEHGDPKLKESLHRYQHDDKAFHDFISFMRDTRHERGRKAKQEYRTHKQNSHIEKKYAKYADQEAYRYALDASSAEARYHSVRESEQAEKEHIRAVNKKAYVLHKRAKVAEAEWKYDVKHQGHKDIEVETVQLDDTYTTESSSTAYGASAAVITGLVIGGSYLYMKKRNAQKVGLESSLLDSQ